jgi:hypothetical protein
MDTNKHRLKSDLRAHVRARLEKISPAVRARFSPFANGSGIV